MKVLWYLVSWCKTYKLSDKWWENMLISTTHFRFRVPCENFELFKFLTDVRMVSIIQLRFFQSLLQLVHAMNFKRRTCTLEVEDSKKKKKLQTPCWKEKDRSAACVGKIQHRKNCVVKECVVTKCLFYKKSNFDLERILIWFDLDLNYTVYHKAR